MKLFNDDDMLTRRVGNFQFSGVRPDKLGAPEYTLVTITTDETGSLQGFESELVAMKKAIIEACRRDPRAEFLMVRDVWFAEQVREAHGFNELMSIDPASYQEPTCTGMTALYDATYSSLAATNEYAKTLRDNDFNVNAVIFVITDGDDNQSSHTVADIRAEMTRGVKAEFIESVMVILVGINAQRFEAKLTAFKNDAGLTQYVDAGAASPQNLARLANFVSKSISSQSQALGTGGPSQALNF